MALTLDGSGTCTAAKVAIGAVAITALPVPDAAAALIGTKVDDDALAAAAAASSALAKPITDKRGTVEYRKKVVGVLTKRAGAIAATAQPPFDRKHQLRTSMSKYTYRPPSTVTRRNSVRAAAVAP